MNANFIKTQVFYNMIIRVFEVRHLFCTFSIHFQLLAFFNFLKLRQGTILFGKTIHLLYEIMKGSISLLLTWL